MKEEENIAILYHRQSVMLKPLENELKKQIKRKYTVLDLGCGTGILLDLVQKLVGNGGHIVAVDKDKNMIKFCKKCFSGRKIDFKILSAEKLSNLNIKFDVVVASLVLQFTNPKKTISEIRKILKKNGKLIFAIPLFRSGISAETDNSSARFRSQFKKNFVAALKKAGKLRFKNINFEYPNSRESVFKKILNKNNFSIITWKVEALEKSNLNDMLEYYKVPWRSEKIVKMPFAERYKILSQALRNTFNEYPKFKVSRYYLIATATKNE